jgi:hypothetical protein
MTFDESHLLSLLMPQEIVILMRQCPSFALPSWVPFARRKMDMARALLARGTADLREVLDDVTHEAGGVRVRRKVQEERKVAA